MLAENRSERMIRLKLHGALINYGDTKEHECPVFEVVLERGAFVVVMGGDGE